MRLATQRGISSGIPVLVSELMVGLVPIVWVLLIRRAGLSDLGLKRGRWSLQRTTGIGLITGVTLAAIFGDMARLFFSAKLTVSYLLATFILTPTSGYLISAWIVGPISEEVCFRGFFYPIFRQKFGIEAGLLIQSAMFYGFHAFNSELSIATLLCGLAYGLLYELTGSLYPCIVGHSIYNFIIVVLTALQKAAQHTT